MDAYEDEFDENMIERSISEAELDIRLDLILVQAGYWSPWWEKASPDE